MVCFCVLLTNSLPNQGALNQERSAPWRIETFLALTAGPGTPPSLQRLGHSPQQRIIWPRSVRRAEVGRAWSGTGLWRCSCTFASGSSTASPFTFKSMSRLSLTHVYGMRRNWEKSWFFHICAPSLLFKTKLSALIIRSFLWSILTSRATVSVFAGLKAMFEAWSKWPGVCRNWRFFSPSNLLIKDLI